MVMSWQKKLKFHRLKMAITIFMIELQKTKIIMMTQNYLIDIHLISRWQFMMLILIDCIILNLIHKIFDLSLT